MANDTTIRISAIDQTREAFRSVQNNIQGLSGKLKFLGGALAGAFAGFQVGSVLKQTGEFSKEIDRLAALSNLSVERFQELSYGAERVGISTEKLADIFKDTQDKVGDFVQTGAGPLADFFENIAPQMGITIQQFQKLSGADALQLYVSSLEKANLSQSEMTFYLEAIASDSALLLPLLQNNGAAFNALAEEARNLGVILDAQAIKQGREFADNMQRLDSIMGTLGKSIANLAIPKLNEFALKMMAINDVAKTEGGLFMTLLKLTNAAEKFGFGVGDKVTARMEELRKSTEATTQALKIQTNQTAIITKSKKDQESVTERLTERNAGLVKLINELKSPYQVLTDRIKELNDAYEAQGISLEMFQTGLMKANDAYEDSLDKVTRNKTALEEYKEATQDLNRNLQNVAVSGLQNLEDALLGVMTGTMSVKDAFKSMAISIINDLIRIQIQRSITGPLSDALGSLFSGGQAPVTGKAIGGAVSAGSPYMVGERGPEMFIPNSSGAIVPNDKLQQGQGAPTIVQNINISTGVSQTVRTEIMSMLPRITEATKAAVADSRRRGGTFAKAFA
jgi:hypothetical protein